MASKRRNTMLPDESTFASTGMGVYTPPERQLTDNSNIPSYHPSNSHGTRHSRELSR